MSPDQLLIEQIPIHIPMVIWISSKKSPKLLADLDEPIAISILYELEKFSYIETSIETIAKAFNTQENEIRGVISNLFSMGYFKQITIYQKGKAIQIMFDKNDKHPHYTPTEIKILQKVTPIWEKK